MGIRRHTRNGLTVLALLSLAACGTRGTPPERSGRGGGASVVPEVEGYLVTPGPLEHILVTGGTLKPFEETVLAPETAGRVVALNLPEGQPVRQGALLVKLFDGDLQAQYAKAQAQLALARQSLARQSELLGVNGVSQAEVDAAALQVNAAQAEVEVLKAQIRKTEILAPFDGVVGLRQVSLGAEVSPGTVIASLRSVDRLKLDFSVPERYAPLVRPGLRLSFVTQEGGPARSATVTATETAVDLSTRTLNVRALVDGSVTGLLPGTYASVTLTLGGNPQALLLPTQAIIPQESGKTVIVARQGKAVFVPVRTGARRAADVEITEGLAAGDTVVLTGLQMLKPGVDLRFSRVQLGAAAP
jgi:membrane fusion protein (multidrug efflux system)